MCTKASSGDCRSDALERLGPITLKLVAFAAGLAVFVPLLAAFALPFVG